MSKSIDWINILKGVGVLFVVVGHLSTPMSKFIFSWHMPLFFFVSGFFINKDTPITDHIVKNFKRIMFPYLIFGALGITVEIIKRVALKRESVDIIILLKGFLFEMDASGLKGHYGFLLWFLPSLFIGRCILQALLNKKVNGYLVLFISFISLWGSFYFNAPFGLDNGLANMVWIFTGYLFYQKFSHVQLGEMKYLLFFFIIVLTISLSPINYPGLDIASKTYSNIFFNFSWAFVVILFFISLSQSYIITTSKFRLIKSFGEQSMLIYVIHPYFNNIAYLIGKNFGWWIYTALAIFFVIIVVFVRGKIPNWRILKYV